MDYLMTQDYCKDWTAIDAIRELVQNALDSNYDYEFGILGTTVKVVTKQAKLEPHHFAMGKSEKLTANSIGKYGEGFKIAMHVLTRLRLSPVLVSNNTKYEGGFYFNEDLQVETFNILEDFVDEVCSDIVFTCQIPEELIDELKAKISWFTPKPLGKASKPVEVIPHESGNIYVNGLFVCSDENLVYSYNFRPDAITLNRDRNMASGIQWTLGEAIASHELFNAEQVFDLLERDAFDVGDYQYFTGWNTKLQSELVRLLINKYGEGVEIGKPGTNYSSGGVSFGNTGYRVFRDAGIKERTVSRDPEDPDMIIEQFIKDNRRYLRRDVRNRLTKLAVKAKGWSRANVF